MWNNAAMEFKRSPILVIAAVTGVIVSSLSIMFSWMLSKNQTIYHNKLVVSEITETIQLDINLVNLLLVIAFFISSIIASAIFIRFLARKHGITAFFASIPLTATINFLTMLVLYLVPPRPLSQELFTNANDLALYASAAIFIAICGQGLLVGLATSEPKKMKNGTNKSTLSDKDSKESENEFDSSGLIIMDLIFLFLWNWLVFSGQSRLSQVFLPEIAHPIEKINSSEQIVVRSQNNDSSETRLGVE